MKRRDVLKTVVLGATGTALGAQTLIAAAPAASAAPASVAAQAAGGSAWKPLLFDAHQNETVTALSELIIPATDTPGAKAARVNEYIDLILHDGDLERRHSFIKGLGWLDGHAIAKHNAPFVNCTGDEQTAILKSLDGAEGEDLQPGAGFFRQVKQLTVDGYYSTKIGIDELNKDGRVPESYGCDHPEHA